MFLNSFFKIYLSLLLKDLILLMFLTYSYLSALSVLIDLKPDDKLLLYFPLNIFIYNYI